MLFIKYMEKKCFFIEKEKNLKLGLQSRKA